MKTILTSLLLFLSGSILSQTLLSDPVQGVLSIMGAEADELFSIYNINGMLLVRERYKDGIDVSGFPHGVFFFRNRNQKTSKFIKI